MKNWYPENFAVRLLFCVGVTIAVWALMDFIWAAVITHEPFTFAIVRNLVAPAVVGVVWAFTWKPKQ